MKALILSRLSETHRFARVRTSLALLCALLLQDASAQEERTTPAANPASTTATVSNSAMDAAETPTPKTSTKAQPTEGLSSTVRDILKLSDARVSSEIIVAFIDRSRSGYMPTPTDLIALKEHNVPDEVTSALMKRGAEIEAQTVRIKSDPAAPTIVRQLSSGSYIDPDSYEFFYLHYAYPRALSYSYRTLAPFDPRYGQRVVHAPYRTPYR